MSQKHKLVIEPIKTRIFRESEDLFSFVAEHVKKIPEKSILIITSKIVALSEGRTTEYKSEEQKIKLIKQESDFFLKERNFLFTIKDGMVMAFAGIDESNGDGKLIFLPEDSFESASMLRKKLIEKYNLKNLGVLITDSGFIPLRNGAVGMAIGYAGFQGIKNYIGKRDIFGRVLKMSKTNIADSLAASAVLSMGEGSERSPLAIITNAPVKFTEKINKKEMKINTKKDIYAPLFNKLS